MKATLTVVKGKSKGSTLEISDAGNFTVGRSRKNSLRVSDTSVSREHCRIEFDGQFFWLVDSGSANGTIVNKRKVTRYLMYDDDVIKIGKTRILFKLDGQNGSSPGS